MLVVLLGRPVQGVRIDEFVLVDVLGVVVVWRSVDGRAGGPRDPLDLVVERPGGLEYVVRPHDVGVERRPRVLPGGVRQQCRQVDDVGSARLPDRPDDVRRLGDVAPPDGDVVGDAELREDMVVRREVVGDDIVASLDQVPGDVRPEEAGAAGDQHGV